jgi:hypothetical protein
MPLIGCHRLGKGAYSVVSWVRGSSLPLIVCNRLGENEPITSLSRRDGLPVAKIAMLRQFFGTLPGGNLVSDYLGRLKGSPASTRWAIWLCMDVVNIIQRCRFVVCLPCRACHFMPHRQLQPSARLLAPQKAQSLRLQPLAGRLEARSLKPRRTRSRLVLGKRLRACHHWHH